MLRNTGASPRSADTPSLSAGPEADGQEGSHLRTVLSSVERASLWKVMMILVGGRSAPYTSRVHLEKERDRKDFRDREQRAGTVGITGVWWGYLSCTAPCKTPEPHLALLRGNKALRMISWISYQPRGTCT